MWYQQYSGAVLPPSVMVLLPTSTGNGCGNKTHSNSTDTEVSATMIYCLKYIKITFLVSLGMNNCWWLATWPRTYFCSFVACLYQLTWWVWPQNSRGELCYRELWGNNWLHWTLADLEHISGLLYSTVSVESSLTPVPTVCTIPSKHSLKPMSG